MLQFVTFKIRDRLLGLNVLKVREINRVLDITPVHKAPDHVRGLVNLRGQIITVIDLAVKLGFPPGGITELSHDVVLAEDLVGFLVDSIGDVVEVEPDHLHPPPANVDDVTAMFVEGVVELEKELLVVLSPEMLLQ